MFDVALATRDWAKTMALTCHYSDELPSTSRWAANLDLETVDQPHLVLTRHQPQGRGRTSERVWIDPGAGRSLTATWLLPLGQFPQPPLPARVGLALASACGSIWPQLPWSLKAPNDLLLDQKKIAGILIEVLQKKKQSVLSIGLGFNIFASPDSFASLQKNVDVTVSDWQKFLQNWHSQLLKIALAPTQLLKADERSQMLALLSASGQYVDLQQVESNSDLIFKGHRISWQEL